jgi:type II secretory ATPase GspE/PulE/Tfp pilus assembly ATPase PilB-like protein
MSVEYSTAQRVLDALVGTGILTSEQLTHTVSSAAAEGASPGPLLVSRGLVSPDDIATVLEEELGVPRVDLSSYAPEDEALALVPAGVARDHRLLPLFEIEGILTAAIGDPVDVFVLDEVGAQIGMEIEPVLTESGELLEAIVQNYGDTVAGEAEAAPTGEDAVQSAPLEESSPEHAPLSGAGDEVPETSAPAEARAGDGQPVAGDAHPIADTPPAAPASEEEESPEEAVSVPVAPILEEDEREAETIAAQLDGTIQAVAAADETAAEKRIDLDVLAVADSKKVAVLVSDIVDAAVRAGASHIQVLPYKQDFFLVFRVKGRLEKVASAPLSMQGALVDGIKQFARLSEVSASLPALGRVRATYGDRDLAITVSAVPTVAGQRVVMTLRSAETTPNTLDALGMSDAEGRALHAMVERGRGMLLVCGPVAGGRSQTYYALLARAAEVGKTVYSVERSIDYELPSVAQVMVNPGSPVRPSAYIAAGLRQDTDVIAVDSLQGKEDVHLAVEAAGRGRLVIATFAAGDVMEGVRRILDLGVEPHSLAAALTVAVGQRLVRTNCPNCSEPERSTTSIPGLPADASIMAGSGCPNCRQTGFGGVTGVFEVLPFGEGVRSVVARDAGLDELQDAARAAGMRPLVRSGVAKVETGEVSAAELARVLRLPE